MLEAFLQCLTIDRSTIESPEQYPFSIPAIRNLDRLPLHPKMTLFVGENGSGKSTLLEAVAIATGHNPEGGSRNFNFETQSSHSELHKYVRVVRGTRRNRDSFFLRTESMFNLATNIDQLDLTQAYGGTSLHKQSHGESLLSLVQSRFRGNGIYLLDEPEAALSPSRQMSLLSLMHQLIEDGSQFIIATHSPILLGYPDADIYLFDTHGIRTIAYEETEHYTVTRDFLNRREQMLQVLLK